MSGLKPKMRLFFPTNIFLLGKFNFFPLWLLERIWWGKAKAVATSAVKNTIDIVHNRQTNFLYCSMWIFFKSDLRARYHKYSTIILHLWLPALCLQMDEGKQCPRSSDLVILNVVGPTLSRSHPFSIQVLSSLGIGSLLGLSHCSIEFM